MKTILLLLVCIAFSAVGCSIEPAADSEPKGKTVEIPKIEASDRSTDLTCYSGGTVIYKGSSIGKIRMTSPAYQIKDKLDGKEKFISGDCVAIVQK